MGYPFPSEAWLQAFADVLNTDEKYASTARKWEGDFIFIIDPHTGEAGDPAYLYMDLWHGACRGWTYHEAGASDVPEAQFGIRARLDQIQQVLTGELDPMQAMLTRRLQLEGSMAYMMRNVPTVLDFVRCAKSVEIAD